MRNSHCQCPTPAVRMQFIVQTNLLFFFVEQIPHAFGKHLYISFIFFPTRYRPFPIRVCTYAGSIKICDIDIYISERSISKSETLSIEHCISVNFV